MEVSNPRTWIPTPDERVAGPSVAWEIPGTTCLVHPDGRVEYVVTPIKVPTPEAGTAADRGTIVCVGTIERRYQYSSSALAEDFSPAVEDLGFADLDDGGTGRFSGGSAPPTEGCEA
jgi:hypothetical protein